MGAKRNRQIAAHTWLLVLDVARRRGWSQAELARRVGCDRSYLSHAVNKRHAPCLETLLDLAEALCVDPGLLLPTRANLERMLLEPAGNLCPDTRKGHG